MAAIEGSQSQSSAARTAKVVVGAVAVCVALIACVVVLVLPYAQDADACDDRLLVAIDEQLFPDAAWRTFVAQSFDTNGDGYLSEQEAQVVTHIGSYDTTTYEVIDAGISNKGITSLAGIERFKNLEMLVAQGNDFASLDVTGNPHLQYLDVRGNASRFDVNYTNDQANMQILVDEGAQVVSDGKTGGRS